jgi:hypothetical protein
MIQGLFDLERKAVEFAVIGGGWQLAFFGHDVHCLLERDWSYAI